MRQLVTADQMREIDRYAMETAGIPSMVLMERAALSVAEEIRREKIKTKRVLVVCGVGNNGADGAAIARILFLWGYDVTVLTVGGEEKQTQERKLQLDIDRQIGIPVQEFGEFLPAPGGILVDALFGVGLGRSLEGTFRAAVEMMERLAPDFTVAVDLPSGIHSDTGRVMGTALRADLTVSFGYEKLGTALYPGKEFAGRLIVREIGFPPCEREDGELWKHSFYTFDQSDRAQIPVRKPDTHKGIYGKVLIAAGSHGMCGAAYLSALAAYRTGAGLVKILTVEENREILQSLLPEAILSSYTPQTEEEEPEKFREFVERECAWASVIVLGPGLSEGRHVAKLLEYVLLSAYVPIVLDADGLGAAAKYPHLTDYFTENVIVTPHLGEMARLTGKTVDEIKEDPVGTAVGYCEDKGVTCVLKDAVTVVAQKDGSVFINSSGNAGMAKAGAGDVLAGAVAGLIAVGLPEDRAAALGVYLHGLAGDKVLKRRGIHSILAREIADAMMQEEGESPRYDGEESDGSALHQNLCGD